MNGVAVALPVPLRQTFDYLAPETLHPAPKPGARVRVPLGRRTLIGVVVGDRVARPAPAAAKAPDYRAIEAVLDADPLLPPTLLALCRWCARYYHHAVGEALAAALPTTLRRGDPAPAPTVDVYRISAAGRAARATLSPRARQLGRLLQRLCDGPADRSELRALGLAGSLPRACDHGWVDLCRESGRIDTPASESVPAPTLTPAQQTALDALAAGIAAGQPCLLQGVTGSGKTELYLRLAERTVEAGGQALILAPEIGLTPQLVERFVSRFGGRFGHRVACYHSGMGEAERTRTWLRARAGAVDVVIGTRSAIFVPLARPGLIVVDEEHDTSYKQQDGLRYSARDLAVVRARLEGTAAVLGSATPSLESLHNAARGRYRKIALRTRISANPAPRISVLDIRGQPLQAGLSAPLLQAVDRHLHDGGQVLLFINRRGFAPVLLCGRCGWIAPCPHCNARLTLHRRRRRLLCHHCGHLEPVPSACPACGKSPLTAVGQGTERIEAALRQQFPGRRIERVDSDRSRSATVLETVFAAVRGGEVDVLVGTQILAKGHDFSGLSLAGLVDVDQALYGSDFRALERLGQLLTQVAGRVGRADRRGEVILQTFDPQHRELQRLVRDGYDALACDLLIQRRRAALPPLTYLALLRAEAAREDAASRFLENAAERLLASTTGVEILGPVPAPMERRAGRHRAQLLLRATRRAALHAALDTGLPLIDALSTRGGLRWSLDVDPADLF